MKHIRGQLKSLVWVWRILPILVLSLSLGTGVCLAHKINVFAIVEKDSLVVEGYFSGKVKAENSPVEVYDSTGAKVATGRTDTQGVCKINLAEIKPIKGDLKVVIATGDGHRAEYTVKAAEIPSKLK
jgi:nickel transport protein